MPKGSDALIASRKEEIVSACAQLYENMGFKEITLGDIGKRTSFTRTSIYNYFQTKEEIFLALLQREYEAWISDLEAEMAKQRTLSADALAGMLADTLQRRRCMLKLMSMNLYDMEGNSRMENLVAFKRVYAHSMMTVSRCLQSWMPAMKEEDIQDFSMPSFRSYSAYILIQRSQKSRKQPWPPRRSAMAVIPSGRSSTRLSSGCFDHFVSRSRAKKALAAIILSTVRKKGTFRCLFFL